MTDNTPHQQLDRIISGYWISQAVYAAAKFGIADLLHAGPLTAEQLAEATSTHPGALYRLLRALASVGIFAEDEQNRFALTSLAEPLRSDATQSKRALALMMGDEQFHAWSEIEHSIRTGRTAFEKVYGQPIFDYLARHPEKARIFDEAMTGIHGRESQALIDGYDFAGIDLLADLGGGNGSQLAAVLQQHSGMRGILFDLPHVIERARPNIEAAGVADRCELVGGSFFESVPGGAGAYLMRHIIHDWDDEQSLAILRTCHEAMAADSKLLLVESVIPPGNEPFGGKLLDLVMLLVPGGKERTAEEYRSLLAQARFELKRIVPTDSEISIIEAVKA